MIQINDRQNPHCLNCGYTDEGEFCSNCGQRKIRVRKRFIMLIGDFFDNYFNFDSKLSRTLLPLLFRPGFLTNAYRNGERSAYFVPIRLYIFISIVLFLILPLYNFQSGNGLQIDLEPDFDTTSRISELDSLADANLADTASADSIDVLGTIFPKFKSVGAYMAYYDSLPEPKRPGYFTHLIAQRSFRILEDDPKSVSKDVVKEFFNQFPKIAFLLLPIFALLLKMLHLRKPFYYEEHFIHSLHFHGFVFLLLLLLLPFSDFTGVFLLLLAVLPAIYLFVSLRKVYGGSVWSALGKLITIVLVYAFVFTSALIFTFLLAAIMY